MLKQLEKVEDIALYDNPWYYSEKTMRAVREALEIENDPNAKRYKSIEELRAALEEGLDFEDS